MLKFAANLNFLFTDRPFTERFDAAAAAGFAGVEFLFPYDYEPDEIAALVRKSGVTLALHNGPPGDWAAGERGLAARADCQDRFRKSVDTILRYCRSTGLSQVHIMAGCVEDGDRRTAEQVFLENLHFASSRLSDEGITALIEPINPIDMPGYFLTDVAQAIDIIRTVGAANLKLQYDCYHRAMVGADVVGGLHGSFADIAHVQIAGYPKRHEPSEGTLDYQPIFSALDQLGYDGWIGCEYHPKTDTEAGLAWLSATPV